MNKKQLTEKCRELLYKYNGLVSDPSDYEFLIAIFKNHPNWTKKQGVGIDHIEVRINPTWKNKCFWIYRIDNTNTDISFNECISSTSIDKKIECACRNAISQIIIEERNKYINKLPFNCPITGDLILDSNSFHIDHYDLTFKEVFKSWLVNQNKELLINSLNNDSEDKNSKVVFTNQDIINDFINFHNNHTHLRAVSIKANLSVLKKKNNGK